MSVIGKLALGERTTSKVIREWERKFIPYLRSALVGGQWP